MEKETIGLGLTLASSITFLTVWFAKMAVDTGNFMTSVERVMGYHKIPPEAVFETTEDTLAVATGNINFVNVHMRYRE
ncbi:MAG: hypothetical protein V2I33_24650, partial [Kangiellaceae bacterium]|nr:hypothetical protein [Kangiellaceae bacterium]